MPDVPARQSAGGRVQNAAKYCVSKMGAFNLSWQGPPAIDESLPIMTEIFA